MLLIALTGPVGSEKTGTILEIADRFRGRVDGFAQPALERAEGRGADAYQLQFLPDGPLLSWLQRRPEGGYDQDADTLGRLQEWATGLAERPSADLILLDEFGRWEAAGEGHFPLWSAIRDSRPKACVISVREDVLEEVQSRLDHRFDLVVRTTDADPAGRILDAIAQRADWERIGVFGTGSGGFEASVGAAFHTVRFPLTGLVMSSAQSVVMTAAAERLERRERVVWVAYVSAGLKALSPSGARLGPMVAISLQGLMITAAYRLIGWNRVGAFTAGALAGTWAGLHGFFIQYLLFGKALQKAYDAVVGWIQSNLHLGLPGLTTTIFLVAGLYGVIAGFATMVAWGWRGRSEAQIQARISRHASAASAVRLGRSAPAWRDLVRPTFLVPLVIVAVILFMSGSPTAEITWTVLRACAVTLAIFGLARWIDPFGLVRWLQKKGKWGPAYALSHALRRSPPS